MKLDGIIRNKHLIYISMRKYKFEEEVVEEVIEETTTEENVEEAPDQHEQFVNILVDMGLSAEQAEAVHSMAMDLIDAGGSEETTEEVSTEEKIEASRQGRPSKFARRERQNESARTVRPARTEMSEKEMTEGRVQRTARRLRRQNIELKKQLRELGASPAAPGLRNAPTQEATSTVGTKTIGKSTSQALDMINNYGK